MVNKQHLKYVLHCVAACVTTWYTEHFASIFDNQFAFLVLVQNLDCFLATKRTDIVLVLAKIYCWHIK